MKFDDVDPDDHSVYGIVSSLTPSQKRWILVAADVLVVPVALYLAIFARDGSLSVAAEVWADWPLAVALMAFGGLASTVLGVSHLRLNGFESAGFPRTFGYSALVAVVGASVNQLADASMYAPMFLTFGVFLFLGVMGSRLFLRWILLKILNRRRPRTAVIIYGAGRTGIQLASALRHDPFVVPVAYVDDNPALHRVLVAGLPVFAPIEMAELIQSKGVSKVLLAMPSLSSAKRSRIFKQLEPLGVDVQALPSFAQLVGEEPLAAKLAPVNPSDFLQRRSFESDMSLASDTLKDRVVLITGAGGSIGSELCRQLLALAPKRIVILDSSELALYSIDLELRGLNDRVDLVPVLGSVTDERLCRGVLAKHGVEIILHAAAYKHVPMVEINPISGLQNNVLGTKVLAEAARDAAVERFILVSSDKAVRRPM